MSVSTRVAVPEAAKDLLDKAIICTVSTVMPNGQPQVTAVWFDYDGEYIRINTAEGRQKARNLKLNSKVTVFILDPQNAYHFLEWRGHVAQIKPEAEGGRDHINALSLKYRGNPVYKGLVENEKRIMYYIAADKVNGR